MTTPVTETDWTLDGSDGEVILGNAHLPSGKSHGALLIAHGFKGYKDYGFIPSLAQRAAEAGFCAYRFNFSHSGMTHETETFQRPDLFQLDTWNRQIHDLHTIHQAVREGRLPSTASQVPTIWFGHSRGAVTCLLAAARLAPIAATGPLGVIAAASPDTAFFLDEHQRQVLRRLGRIESPSSRTGQILHIGGEVLAEIEQNPDAFNPVLAVAQLDCPVLVIHGDGDQTVPVAAAARLAAAAPTRARKHVVQGASHTFDAPNPLDPEEIPPTATSEMIATAVSFASTTVRGRTPS